VTDEIKIECRSCGQHRPLDEYRFFQIKPELLYMDFCVHCEQREGTLALYRRFSTYATAQIVDAVFAAARVPEEKRTDAQKLLIVEPKLDAPPKTNEELLQRELARRELCRRRLMYFTTTFDSRYTPGWVHQDVARRLERFVERVERRESPRLILCMPPRIGKSRETSDMFPSWLLGKHPEWDVVQASYGAELAEQFSRNVRDRVRDDEFVAIFPETKLRTDSQSISTWRTTSGGGYQAVGVGGPLTGRGFHVGIIDDPVKDAEAAASETIRNNIWSWFQAVFRTRAAPGAGIILIMTRWHYNDLAGKLLEQREELLRDGASTDEIDDWELVEYPAIATDDEHLLPDGRVWRGALPEDVELADCRRLRAKGEALHPERYPLRELMKTKHALTAAVWSALYQQNPTPDDGDFFKRADIKYRRLDKAYWPLCRRFITADYALRKKQRNDFTVLTAFALDWDNNLFVIGMRRGRWGTYEIARQIVEMVRTYKPEVYAGEQGQIHYAVWPVAQTALDAAKLSVSVDETLVPVTEKEVRARPLQARTQLHRLFFSYDDLAIPDEYVEAEKEMLRFPNGQFDDTVDSLSWGARLALNLSLPARPITTPKIKSWRDELLVAQDHGSFMSA